jgi:hypothetical protein
MLNRDEATSRLRELYQPEDRDRVRVAGLKSLSAQAAEVGRGLLRVDGKGKPITDDQEIQDPSILEQLR